VSTVVDVRARWPAALPEFVDRHIAGRRAGTRFAHRREEPASEAFHETTLAAPPASLATHDLCIRNIRAVRNRGIDGA